MIATNILCVFVSFVSVISEVQSTIEVKKCSSQPEPNAIVKAIRVTACDEQPCTFVRGKSYTFEFDFIPTVTTSKVDVAAKAFATIKWPGVETNACKSNKLKCPVQKGQLTTYKSTVAISPTYPAIKVPVDWIITLNDTKVACFLTDVQIESKSKN